MNESRYLKSRQLVLVLLLPILTACQQDQPVPVPNKTVAAKAISQELEFESLEFKTAELRDIANVFHEFAERSSDSTWHVDRYRQAKSTSRPLCKGRWQSSQKKNSDFLKSQRPYQEFLVRFERDSRDGAGRVLDRIESQNTWVPTEGWGARIYFNNRRGWYGTLGKVDADDGCFSFSSATPSVPLQLDSYTLVYPFQDESGFGYSYFSGLITELQRPENLQSGNLRADVKTIEKLNLNIETDFEKVFRSAETMQKVLCDDIARMRSIARYEIVELGKVTVVDIQAQNFKSRTSIPERPPHRNFPDKPIDAATKQAMLAQVNKKLDEREKLIRNEGEKIYAAISKAVPPEVLTSLAKVESDRED